MTMSIATHLDVHSTRTLTSDVIDVCGDQVRLLDPVFHDYGALPLFHGPVTTLKCFEDNLLIRHTLEEDGAGRVLVIDGGGSSRHSLIGGNLADMAAHNGWAGLIIFGYVRDSVELAEAALGIKALGLCPRSSFKTGVGARDIPVRIGGHMIAKDDYVYADRDGIVVAHHPVHLDLETSGKKTA